ncbi:MAG: hypothetical protein ACI9HK_004737 [Pirellulaceae bacterium]|jgi:hypothetical protein
MIKYLAAILACAAILATPLYSVAQDSSAGSSSAPVNYFRWAAKLESPLFKDRQAASRELAAGGQLAIPALKEAVNSGGLESITRALSILGEFNFAEDEQLATAARAALDEIRETVAQDRRARVVGALDRTQGNWQNEAVERLRSMQANVSKYKNRVLTVDIDQEWTGGNEGLRYLRYLHGTKTLNFPESTISDEGLAHLAPLPDVQILRLGRTSVKGPGLAYLQKMKSLVFLSLKGSDLAPGALKYLAGCSKLQSLGLDDTNVTNQDLGEIDGLAELRNIWLNQTKVTDDGMVHLKKHQGLSKIIMTGVDLKGPGLAHLAELNNLEYLSLQFVKLEDSGMPFVGKLTQVATLGLDDTLVTDAGMKYLTTLDTNLATLWLSNTKVTDDSIEHFKKLTSLRRIILRGTEVSKEGVKRLKTAMPKCTVEHDYEDEQKKR